MVKDITLVDFARDDLVFKKISSKSEISGGDKIDGYLVHANEKEVRRIIDSSKGSGKRIAVIGQDDNFNRRMLETCRIDYLVFPDVSINARRDSLKQRDSGLNHVLAKIAKQRDIAIVVNFTEICKLAGSERAVALSRVMQNIKVCRKAGCNLKIATFAESEKELRNLCDLKAFAFSLGMSSQQVKRAFEF